MRKTVSGFTITELVVAISIIGIIFAFSAVSFVNIQAGSRDSERTSKASVLAEYLEKYHEQNGEYPSCNDISGDPDTVQESVLLGIDTDVLTTPKAQDNNSVACDELSEFDGADDVFAYVGDGSGACAAGGTCSEFTIQYLEERSGTIRTIESRNRVASIEAPTVTNEVISSSQISVSWSTVLGSSSYTMSYDTSETFTDSPQSSSTSNTSTELTSLSGATTYYVRVAAVVDGQQGPWSSTATATTGVPEVGSLSLTVDSGTQITANWGAVSGASSYTLDRSTSSDFSSPTTVNDIATNSYTSSGLETGERYYFRVRAVVNSTFGDWSNTANETTAISAPSGVSATMSSTIAINVSWNSISAASGYIVDYSTSSSFSSHSTITTSSTSTTVSGLSDGTKYYFRVRGNIGSYEGPNSNTVNATTKSVSLSSSKYCSDTYSGRDAFQIRVRVNEVSYNLSNNTSNVSWSIYRRAIKNGWASYDETKTWPWGVNIGGQTSSGSSNSDRWRGDASSIGDTESIASGTKTISHDSNGSKTISFSGYDGTSSNSSNIFGRASCSSSYTLSDLR